MISCILSAVSFSIPHAFLQMQLFQSDQMKLRIKLAQKFRKHKKNISIRKFLMKTILTSFDFMQNFDFILT